MKAMGGTTSAAIHNLRPVNWLEIIETILRALKGVGRPRMSGPLQHYFLKGAYQAARPSVIDLPTSAGVA